MTDTFDSQTNEDDFIMGSQVYSRFSLDALGFYSWDVIENKVTGDEVFARIYGFSRGQAEDGVSVETVLARIFIEDRERLAREIHDAILTGASNSTAYRVLVDGKLHTVTAFGRCLRSSDGLPTNFVGAVSVQNSPLLSVSGGLSLFTN